MERWLRRFGWLGQRPDDVEILDHRARPPMGENQWCRVRPAGPDMQEVDRLPVDLGDELRIRVEPRLHRPPVEPVQPVPRQLPNPLDGLPIGIPHPRPLIRPTYLPP